MGTPQDIASALQRVESVLQRRPATGMQEDAPATAQWHGGLRVVTRHASGMQVTTDMPAELGGSGDQVTPGWLFRAALASCAATSIALAAAKRGIPLGTLEVQATSRSDTRGLLGMKDTTGASVCAGPQEMGLRVRIAAPGVAAECLRTLVADACSCSPIPSAVQRNTPLEVLVDVGADASAEAGVTA